MMENSERPFLKAVVAGTDFSGPADTALSWAMLIARAHKAVLHVVHAVTRTLPLVERFEPSSPFGMISSAYAQERLLKLGESLQSPDQAVECQLAHARPSVAILGAAQRARAGLIVLGTRGEGGLRHLLLGSTAERVAQRSSGAVLTVSPESKRASRWPSRILLATDFSLEADAALYAVESLLRPYDERAEVLLLTVLPPPEGLGQHPEAANLWRMYVEECRQLLAERMQSLKDSSDSTGVSTRALLREGIPAEEIVRVAIEENADLIALGSRGAFAAGRDFLGSVSKRVIQTASCPTLTVPSLLSGRMRLGPRG